MFFSESLTSTGVSHSLPAVKQVRTAMVRPGGRLVDAPEQRLTPGNVVPAEAA